MTASLKSSHTPGPWRLVKRTETNFGVKAPVYLIHGAEGEGAVMRCEPFGGKFPSAEANARLIAAAPEMLEALKAVLGEFTAYEMSPDQQRIADRAKAAISKAEGGQA